MSVERARSDITRALPPIRVDDIRLLGAGVDSDAYLVNGEWVFRFPKREAASMALAREIALLPNLAERLPVQVPYFEYVGEQAEGELLFVGYRLIPGKPLTPELFEALSHEAQERVLATLAEFLEIVHAFPIADAQMAGVEHLSTRKLVADLWKRVRSEVLAQLSPADGRAVSSLIEQFLNDPYNFSNAPRLLYADFAPEHILYDRDADEISGIIDWGDMAIGDPDYDLTYLYQDYGAAFVERLLVHLTHAEPARLFQKLRVFNAYDYLSDLAILPDSPDDDDPAALVEARRVLSQLAREG